MVRYRFWKVLRDFAEDRMKYTWPHSADSCCPRCKFWESSGNLIATKDVQGEFPVSRTCGTCNYTWRALPTPAGFVPLNQGEN